MHIQNVLELRVPRSQEKWVPLKGKFRVGEVGRGLPWTNDPSLVPGGDIIQPVGNYVKSLYIRTRFHGA